MATSYSEIQRMMTDVPSFVDPINNNARVGFKLQMCRCEYGYDAMLDAWHWYLAGFDEGNRLAKP